MDQLLSERKNILLKGKLTKADKERLYQLEQEIGILPSGQSLEEIQAMDIIRRAAARLKQQGTFGIE